MKLRQRFIQLCAKLVMEGPEPVQGVQAGLVVSMGGLDQLLDSFQAALRLVWSVQTANRHMH